MLAFIDRANRKQQHKHRSIEYHEQDRPSKGIQSLLIVLVIASTNTFSTIPNNVFNMEVTEALATCLLVTGQQCEINHMTDRDTQEALLKEFQRCMHQVVQSALGRSSRFYDERLVQLNSNSTVDTTTNEMKRE
jgi:hypothetical protein